MGDKRDTDRARAELERVDAMWAAAAAGRDVERIVSFWADDAIVIPPGQLGYYRQGCNSGLRDCEPKDPGFQHPMEDDSVYDRSRLRPRIRRRDERSFIQRREWQSSNAGRKGRDYLANGQRRCLEVCRRHLERRPAARRQFTCEVPKTAEEAVPPIADG